jgi:menaquinone-9 beta-reductase
VAIVGGGPAGISTALFAAHDAPRLRDDLVVLERDPYPREKICAGAIGARAERLLGRLGVFVDVPSVPINGIAFRAMGRTRVVREPKVGRVVRRVEFDQGLARLAQGRGIDVREGVTVRAVERVASGFELDTSKGKLRADVVVGADGVRSIVRRAMGLEKTPYLAQALEVDTEGVDTDLPRDVIVFDASNRELPGYYWDFPTLVDGKKLVCRGVYHLKGPASRGVEIRDVLEGELRRRGLDIGSLRQKRYAERGYHRASTISGPGLLLVGEAAGIDPVTGEGIAQAIQYGSVAGPYLARKLRQGERRFDDYAQAVARASLGRDLLVRTSVLKLFYGIRRAEVERFLLDTPDFIRVGMQHFGGRRWSARSVARGGGAVAIAAMRTWLHGSLSVSAPHD